MVFSSSIFLFAFLPAVLLVYYLPLRRWRTGQNVFLFLASLFFYGWGAHEALLLMLSPFAPHMVEELWEQKGYAAKYGKMAMQMPWPEYDESKTVTATVQMAVQVSGKVKANIVVSADASDEDIVAAALAEPKIVKLAEGMTLVKSIVVKGKLVSLIFKPQA